MICTTKFHHHLLVKKMLCIYERRILDKPVSLSSFLQRFRLTPTFNGGNREENIRNRLMEINERYLIYNSLLMTSIFNREKKRFFRKYAH
jgi:hypothetical protein